MTNVPDIHHHKKSTLYYVSAPWRFGSDCTNRKSHDLPWWQWFERGSGHSGPMSCACKFCYWIHCTFSYSVIGSLHPKKEQVFITYMS